MITYMNPMYSITCKVASCQPTCTNSPQALSSYDNYKKQLPKFELIKNLNTHNIKIKVPLTGSVHLSIGNINIKNALYQKANCKINYEYSYGCYGCSIKPYVIFKPYDVKSEGILPFTSNCSFEKEYLSCSNKAFKLELLDSNKYCLIFVPLLNKTIYINMTYDFVGNIFRQSLEYSNEDLITQVKTIASDTNLWTSFIST